MHRTRLVFGFVGMLVAAVLRGDAFGITATPTAAGPTPHPSPANLGHFMSYGVKLSKGASFVPLGPVALPRLGGGPYDLQKVGTLLVPADKNGEGVRHAATHLLEYRLKPSKGTRKFSPLANVRVVNQCSDVLVELTKPVAVLVPTAKDLANPVTAPVDPPVDHLLCFDADLQKKGPGGAALPKFPKGMQVQVADQFQSRRYDLTGVTKLCVPTDKTGTPVFRKGADKGKPAPLAPASAQHADEHLLCYKAKLATTEVPQLGCGPATPGTKGTKIPKQPKHASRPGVFVANQLGTLRLDTTKEVELCVPSLADLPSAPSGLRALPGDPQQLVSAATFDLSASPGWTDAQITVEPPSTRFLRTSLGISFTADATVGAANAVLARLGAEIVMMLAGPPYVVVRIPDPGSLDALRALAADVEADPAVASVHLDTIPEPALLPVDFSPRPDGNLASQKGLRYIDHLLQARIAAAWNARGAIKEAPALVIVDFFGDGAPRAFISAEYPNSLDFAVGMADENLHGYAVLGVIAAAPDDKVGPNCFETLFGSEILDCSVGVLPGPVRPRVRAVELVGMNSSLDLEVALAFAIESFAPARVVVNASISDTHLYGKFNAAQQAGQRFIDLVRLRQPESLESKFLLVAAAGNIHPKYPNIRDALTNSPFTAAALHPNLANLTNVIVVDNRFDTDFPFLPGNIDQSSKTGGHLAACGTDVWTVSASVLENPDGLTGTSFASPVVAGVAAYALAIAPELTIAELRSLLIDNAEPREGSTPDLDAYATLLAIDSLPTIADFRVRRAVFNNVDRGNEGKVDAEDVTDFFLFYHDLSPEQRRYGRGDLRAAFAPQTDTVRFDLNVDGIFERITVQAGTHQLKFNEESVNVDVDIMCHAAFAATGPYEVSGERVDPGRDRCCKHYKQFGGLPPDAKCHPCPARGRTARISTLEEEPKPLGAWRLSIPNRLLVYEFFFLEDGTVMIPALSGFWEKGGTWTSTPHEVNGEILYYDVRIDACTETPRHTRYSFEGTWSPRPETDCFGVVSCPFNADGCPAMQGLLTTSDGVGPPGPATPVDSGRAEGIDGWAPLTPPELEECHGGCFEEWWRFGSLACTPVEEHCVDQAAPTCGGYCLFGFTCRFGGGSCSCVPVEP